MSELREKLAELEHKQWESWVQYITANYDIPKVLFEKWKRNWKPYSKLTEEEKDKDRIWADRTISVLIEEIKKWEFAYPKDIFPQLTLNKQDYKKFEETFGYPLDRLSAHITRIMLSKFLKSLENE